MPNWTVGAARDLDIEYRDQWRGDESAKRVLDLAGIGGEKPDHKLAATGFLIVDSSAPDDRGSYKDGFTDVFDGKLKCVSRAIEILPGFIGKTDVPQGVKDEAMRVVDAYKQRIDAHDKAQASATRRKRVPAITAFAPNSFEHELDHLFEPGALEGWDGGLRAALAAGAISIDILDTIGQNPWTGEGVCAADVLAALRSANGQPVAVNINSPGGSYCEGVAIYSALREYEGPVTVNVIGRAASAASIVAMAGDQVRIASGAFIMIHNASGECAGTRHDMADAIGVLEKIDSAMCSVYAAGTGNKPAAIQAMMDAETYLVGADAIAKGFADTLLPSEQVQQDPQARIAARAGRALFEVEAALASAGRSRNERRKLIAEISGGTPRAAADQVKPRADLTGLAVELRELHSTFR